MVYIEMENIEKKFDKDLVIDSFDLEIKSGEILALLGPSGCGKTTILKLISGLLAPEIGDIKFNGDSVLNIPAEKRGAVLVFQDYLLFPHLNVEKNIMFGMKMQKTPVSIRKKRTEELLKFMGLFEHRNHYPNELSGGQRQRVALARALAVKPKVILLDEPLTNLDANLRGEMQEFIRDIHKREKMTTVFVTHDRDEAMLVADRIAVMNKGKVEQVGTAEDLYKFPKSCFVSNFFGSTNYIDGEVDGEFFVFPEGKIKMKKTNIDKDIDIYDGKKLKMMIRPEFIDINGPNDREHFSFKAKIVHRSFVGERILYKIDDGKQTLKVTTLPPSDYLIGDEVLLSIKLEHVWYME
ncbi:MAG: ABC transporter ATP-binding protein [Halanaerobiales bacterium]|nr:ABC transporter ATP-binding protein [Halanaerobiales bacterium]